MPQFSLTRLRTVLGAALTALTLAFTVSAFSAPASVAVAQDKTDIATGGFTNQEYKIRGTWRIYKEDGKTFITLSDDFRTRRAPDLKIFLSPLAPDAVSGRNATDDSVLVAKLTSARGGQTYEVPVGTDLSAYKSVVIHCEQFSKLWGAGPLEI